MLIKEIEPFLTLDEIEKWKANRMQMDIAAFVHLMRRLEPRDKPYHILELGTGATTPCWQTIIQREILPIQLISVHHDQHAVAAFQKQLKGVEGIELRCSKLKQIDDQEWEKLFTHASQVDTWDLFNQLGKDVAPSDYALYTIRNAFYADLKQSLPDEEKVDVLILAGPYGNGRSLAFPLLYQYASKEMLILIHHFDDYDILHDLSRVFNYNEIYREVRGYERWILLQLKKE
ncbi:hypothetical protein IC620_04245 [Hazenella sp. IB182357]|uniref:Uncharacterized protein n=1 Tax=Polycladospora coralii TaxID=2771432 RepID=A0A926RWJ0_9BACL|nr:hypothetical protein [Polycladospora coralii]MBD1371566.1 hypothetical protein [Polycladospora coralii]MBS7529034.1 hypothetical protein [Polycladospora coralii]